MQFEEGISTGVSEFNLDNVIGKLSYYLVELIAKKLATTSFQCSTMNHDSNGSLGDVCIFLLMIIRGRN